VHDPPSDGTRATAATVNPLQVERSLKIDYCRAAGIEWLQDRTAREPSKNPKTTAVYDGFFLEDVLAKSGGFRRSRLFDQHRVALLKAVWVWDAGDCVGVVDSAEFPCTKWPPQDVWRRSLSAALTLVTSPAEDGDHHF
jgi:hypothetical protein